MRTLRSTLPWLALMAGLLSGCAGGQSSSPARAPAPFTSAATAAPAAALPSDVVDVTWQWTGLTTPVEQVSVDPSDRYAFRFEREGRVTVTADCNHGMGSYSASEERRIAFGPIALTRMMCPPGSLSDRFVKELGRASSYFLREGDLFLELPADSGTLRFRRQPAR